MITKRTKWIIAVVVTLVLVGIGKLCISKTDPRDTFEFLVTKPIPQSVSSIQEGNFRALDNVLRVLRFHIAAKDLQTILDLKGYKPMDQNQMMGYSSEEYLKWWEQRILVLAKLEVHMAKDSRGYILDEGFGQKYIFWSTNAQEVLFIANAH
jgi:hypothetical protein